MDIHTLTGELSVAPQIAAHDLRALHEAGFKETRVEPLCGPDSMVIGLK